MQLIRSTVSIARESHNALSPLLRTRPHLSGRFPSNRYSTTIAGKTVCQCGAELPEAEKLSNLFRERNLRQLTKEMSCPHFKSFQFRQVNNCALVNAIAGISDLLLREDEFYDVVSVGDSLAVFLESLHEIPQGELGDLTGDHGKELAKFLKSCLEKNYISSIGAVFDVGGQNTSTVTLVSEVLGNPDLPSMIVDSNPITPAFLKHNLISNTWLRMPRFSFPLKPTKIMLKTL